MNTLMGTGQHILSLEQLGTHQYRITQALLPYTGFPIRHTSAVTAFADMRLESRFRYSLIIASLHIKISHRVNVGILNAKSLCCDVFSASGRKTAAYVPGNSVPSGSLFERNHAHSEDSISLLATGLEPLPNLRLVH